MKRTSSKETNEQKIRRFFNKKKIIQFDADNEPDEFFLDQNILTLMMQILCFAKHSYLRIKLENQDK